ncbi:MAG: IS110 family transposase [Sphingomonadaceae bacterium]|nr:IS110 family transposase [Sphingomonadaceae bacterium]
MIDPTSGEQTIVQNELAAIFISLELSRSSWVVTSLSPGAGERMSRIQLVAGNMNALKERFSALQAKCRVRLDRTYPLIVIQEAGLDAFSLHRALEIEGVESHVVDPASIATSRRRRRAKTDNIDGEALLRALLAYKRGEPRVCAMVTPPSPDEEDRRQICRERRLLVTERVAHANRIKGLLFAQGIADYEPARRDRRKRLDMLQTADGRPLPPHLKQRICRELDRLELVIDQIKAVEKRRDEMIAPQNDPRAIPVLLQQLRGVGPEFAAVLWSEGLFRKFDNRRQLASYAGLAPTPWQSGTVSREQGISKAGNARVRTTMIQLSWLWLRHQPTSALTRWFHERTKIANGRSKRVTIVALARKLLVSLWKFATTGLLPEGAIVHG